MAFGWSLCSISIRPLQEVHDHDGSTNHPYYHSVLHLAFSHSFLLPICERDGVGCRGSSNGYQFDVFLELYSCGDGYILCEGKQKVSAFIRKEHLESSVAILRFGGPNCCHDLHGYVGFLISDSHCPLLRS
jgi:hypothetical protein